MSATIAILDDEARMVEIVSMLLRRAGHEVRGHTSASALLASLEREPVDLLLTDLRMPELDGVEVLTRARRALPGLPVILFTAHATIETAVAALKQGAYDYIQKPFDNAELKALVARALDHARLERENRLLRGLVTGGRLVVAESPAMQRALSLVRRVAPSRSTVLITGESGTGKEVIARAVHLSSDRAAGPFVAINVKALSETLLEAELFGHEKGAFTGADRRRAGAFESAEGGTLFLDEIGEASLALQAKLLRVLQEREVSPVGASRALPVDVRLVAATNRDLEAEIAGGRFRQDLYFRLAVVPIHLPPLRERKEDILPLAQAFLARHARELGRTFEGLSPELEAYLLAHAWPGNVRELENAMERGAVLAEGSRLERSDLETTSLAKSHRTTEPAASSHGASLAEHLERATAAHLARVLKESGGRRQEAAARLGIDRTTLYRLMRKHSLE